MVIRASLQDGSGDESSHFLPAGLSGSAQTTNDRSGSQAPVGRQTRSVADSFGCFFSTVLSTVRAWAAARASVLIFLYLLSGGTVLAQTSYGPVTESPQITAAFEELDALAAAIANRLQDKAHLPGLPLPPPPPGPPQPPDPPPVPNSGNQAYSPPSPPQTTGDGNYTEPPEVDPQTEPEPCGTREDMDLRIREVEERFGNFRQAINGANNDLPAYREGVRDANTRCTAQFESSIASTISRLDRLDIDAAYDVADKLLACVDQQRRTINRKMDQPDKNDVQMTILLTDENDRLTDTTNRVRDIQDLLLRAASKRRRLVEESTQIKHVISAACGT